MTGNETKHNESDPLRARLDEYTSCHTQAGEHCVTCTDEALPARVLRVDPECGLALVQINDEQTEVDITLLDTITPGDTILVHGGVGIAQCDDT